MALACNLGKTDRIARIIAGLTLGIVGLLIRAHFLAAAALGLVGLVILVEGAIGH